MTETVQSQRSISGEAGRIPGDPQRSLELWRGDAQMGPLTSARARWEWRQAGVIADDRQWARCGASRGCPGIG
jgi:hypothetical protein